VMNETSSKDRMACSSCDTKSSRTPSRYPSILPQPDTRLNWAGGLAMGSAHRHPSRRLGWIRPGKTAMSGRILRGFGVYRSMLAGKMGMTRHHPRTSLAITCAILVAVPDERKR
jgi:hypothetical protein